MLRTFNGTTTPNSEVEQPENYWTLIGETGMVLNFAEELGFANKNRVLFQFEGDVGARGLACHNEKPNALWILKTDLRKISPELNRQTQ